MKLKIIKKNGCIFINGIEVKHEPSLQEILTEVKGERRR